MPGRKPTNQTPQTSAQQPGQSLKQAHMTQGRGGLRRPAVFLSPLQGGLGENVVFYYLLMQSGEMRNEWLQSVLIPSE